MSNFDLSQVQVQILDINSGSSLSFLLVVTLGVTERGSRQLFDLVQGAVTEGLFARILLQLALARIVASTHGEGRSHCTRASFFRAECRRVWVLYDWWQVAIFVFLVIKQFLTRTRGYCKPRRLLILIRLSTLVLW